jgi:O-methyltransferase involved in polyketide biosynthesis
MDNPAEIAMTRLNLNSRGNLMIDRVRQAISHLHDQQPLKRWFQIELEMFESGFKQAASMEEGSAYLRALRQLHFIILDHIADVPKVGNIEESMGTQMARIPGALLENVKQTNFSIEPALLLQPAEPVELFELVSPTAKVVSYLRDSQDSLPFAKRLTCHDEAQQILGKLGIRDSKVLAKLSLLFRARYQTINRMLQKNRFRQVMEIASGISPRGLHWSREHPGTVYLESDLPMLMRMKAKAMRDSIFEDTVSRRGVLHCCGVDALDLSSIEHALEYTDPQARLALITEGLLLYFNEKEMKKFLSNMQSVLSSHPRMVWIVDMVSQKNLHELFSSDPGVAQAVRSVFASTDRAVVQSNPFQNDSDIQQCLFEHRMRVENQLSLQATAAQMIQASPGEQVGKDFLDICGSRSIWMIRSTAAPKIA